MSRHARISIAFGVLLSAMICGVPLLMLSVRGWVAHPGRLYWLEPAGLAFAWALTWVFWRTGKKLQE